MKLYSYFRSSAAWRLRIALNLKGLEYDYMPVNLLRAEQKNADYLSLNPQGLVPAMELPGGVTLGQSIALLEWLEEAHPEPPLLPKGPIDKARVRSVVNSICCDIHPICNVAVSNYLKQHFSADRKALIEWYTAWMHRGFGAIEQVLSDNNSRYCFGDEPGFADLCLVPQVYNARRFDIPLENFPHIGRVVANCNRLAAFTDAAPERQTDSA